MTFVYENKTIRVEDCWVLRTTHLNNNPEHVGFHIHRDIAPDIADALITSGAPKRIIANMSDKWWRDVFDKEINPEHWRLFVPNNGDIVIEYTPDINEEKDEGAPDERA